MGGLLDMKKILKFVGILLLVSVVLVVVAIVALPLLVDPNDHKQEIAEQVKKHTGRDLRISGDLKLSVFPWLGVDMGTIELGNAPGFDNPVFAKTEKTQIRVNLKPLVFERRLEMDTIVVQGLTLNLAKNKDGLTNLDDLAKGGGKASDASSGQAAGPGLSAFVLGGLDVTDANLKWEDMQAGTSAQISNLSIQTGAVRMGEAVDLKIAFDLSESGGTGAQVELSTRLSPDLESRVFGLADISLTAKLTGDKLPGGEQSVSLRADAQADLGRQTLSVEGVKLAGMGLEAAGELNATGIQSAPKFTGKFSISEFNARTLLDNLGQSVPDTADPNAMTKIALDLRLAGDKNSVNFEPLTLMLDGSKLTGRAGLSDFSKQAVRFDIKLDQIDADRYLPPADEKAQAVTPGATTAAAGDVPMEQLRALNIDGKALIGKLKIKNLSLTDVTATVKAKDGLIRLSPVRAKLYDGSYSGDISVDARRKALSVKVNEKLAGVQAGPLLKDMQGSDPIAGTANVSVKATTTGNQPDAMKKSLNGNVKFAFLNGAINGVNIPAMLRKAKATLSGADVPEAEGPQKTDFSKLTGSAKIVNGKVNNPDLLAKSPFLRVQGKGEADLVAEQIDYGVTTTLVASMKGQGGDDLSDLVGVPIPIRVTGDLNAPSFGLDTEALLKSQAGAVLNKEKDKVMDKVKEGIGGKIGGEAGGGAAEKAGGLLKGLFN